MHELSPHNYRCGALELKGRLALPRSGNGKRPAVLVLHHALGQGDHDCERAARLADAGYVALVADMYGLGLNPDHAVSGEHFFRVRDDVEMLRTRARAALDALLAIPDVDAGRVGAIGFCFGGMCALELARDGADLRSAVSLHGLLTTQKPAVKDGVRARMLVLTGALDPYAPPADLRGFEQEMSAAEADWQVTLYGKGWHAFTDDDPKQRDIPGVRYDPLLDRLSWAQVMAFLDATVRDA